MQSFRKGNSDARSIVCGVDPVPPSCHQVDGRFNRNLAVHFAHQDKFPLSIGRPGKP
jgi:hypothetical protein